MLRAFALLILIHGSAGCGEPGGSREVPVSRGGAPTSPPQGPDVVTRPGRAIATH